MDVEQLIQEIKDEKDRRLLNQTELAKLANISRQRVWLLFNGKSRSVTTIRALRNALFLRDKPKNAGS